MSPLVLDGIKILVARKIGCITGDIQIAIGVKRQAQGLVITGGRGSAVDITPDKTAVCPVMPCGVKTVGLRHCGRQLFSVTAYVDAAVGCDCNRRRHVVAAAVKGGGVPEPGAVGTVFQQVDIVVAATVLAVADHHHIVGGINSRGDGNCAIIRGPRSVVLVGAERLRR